MNKIESLNIEVGKGRKGVEGIERIKEEIKCTRGQSCRDEMKKKLADLKEKFKSQGIAITAEAEGKDALKIDLKPIQSSELK